MTRTKGDVIIENIKIGDTHYEYFYGMELTCEVITLPKFEQRDDGKYWTWQSKDTTSGRVIDYGVHEKYAHYGPNLYTYPAYISKQIFKPNHR